MQTTAGFHVVAHCLQSQECASVMFVEGLFSCPWIPEEVRAKGIVA